MFREQLVLIIPVCYTGIIHANEAINLNKASDSCVTSSVMHEDTA